MIRAKHHTKYWCTPHSLENNQNLMGVGVGVFLTHCDLPTFVFCTQFEKLSRYDLTLFCVTSISILSSSSLTETLPWAFRPVWGTATNRFRASYMEPGKLQWSIYYCFFYKSFPLPRVFFRWEWWFLENFRNVAEIWCLLYMLMFPYLFCISVYNLSI